MIPACKPASTTRAVAEIGSQAVERPRDHLDRWGIHESISILRDSTDVESGLRIRRDRGQSTVAAAQTCVCRSNGYGRPVLSSSSMFTDDGISHILVTMIELRVDRGRSVQQCQRHPRLLICPVNGPRR